MPNLSEERSRLNTTVYPEFLPVSQAVWDGLTSNFLAYSDMLLLMPHAQSQQYAFHSIVVTDQDTPILILPLIYFKPNSEARFQPHQILSRGFRTWRYKSFLGFAVDDAGHPRVAYQPDNPLLACAWELTLETLFALAEGLQAKVSTLVAPILQDLPTPPDMPQFAYSKWKPPKMVFD